MFLGSFGRQLRVGMLPALCIARPSVDSLASSLYEHEDSNLRDWRQKQRSPHCSCVYEYVWRVGEVLLRKTTLGRSLSVLVLVWERGVCAWEDVVLSVEHVESRDGRLGRVS